MFWRKTIHSKIEKILHMAVKVINGIDDFYKNLYYAAALSQSIKGTFDSPCQRYSKAYLKSTPNSCGRLKSYPTI